MTDENANKTGITFSFTGLQGRSPAYILNDSKLDLAVA